MNVRLVCALAASIAAVAPVLAGPITSASFSGGGGVIHLSASGDVIENWSISSVGAQDIQGSAVYCTYYDIHGVCLSELSSTGTSGGSLSATPTPRITVEGSLSNARHAYSDGKISYSFRVDSTVDDAPDISLPIWIDGSGTFEAFAGNPSTDAQASAHVWWSFAGTTAQHEILSEGVHAFGDRDNSALLSAIGYSKETWFNPATEVSLAMELYGSADAAQYSLGIGDYAGELDPTIFIDPTFSVSYHGQMVPATSLFSLTFSPEIVVEAPPALPEPGTLALLGFGLAGLAASRRRKP